MWTLSCTLLLLGIHAQGQMGVYLRHREWQAHKEPPAFPRLFSFPLSLSTNSTNINTHKDEHGHPPAAVDVRHQRKCHTTQTHIEGPELAANPEHAGIGDCLFVLGLPDGYGGGSMRQMEQEAADVRPSRTTNQSISITHKTKQHLSNQSTIDITSPGSRTCCRFVTWLS
jgi:hypothetical protein